MCNFKKYWRIKIKLFIWKSHLSILSIISYLSFKKINCKRYFQLHIVQKNKMIATLGPNWVGTRNYEIAHGIELWPWKQIGFVLLPWPIFCRLININTTVIDLFQNNIKFTRLFQYLFIVITIFDPLALKIKGIYPLIMGNMCIKLDHNVLNESVTVVFSFYQLWPWPVKFNIVDPIIVDDVYKVWSRSTEWFSHTHVTHLRTDAWMQTVTKLDRGLS